MTGPLYYDGGANTVPHKGVLLPRLIRPPTLRRRDLFNPIPRHSQCAKDAANVR
jgi:hypothetical protein